MSPFLWEGNGNEKEGKKERERERERGRKERERERERKERRIVFSLLGLNTKQESFIFTSKTVSFYAVDTFDTFSTFSSQSVSKREREREREREKKGKNFMSSFLPFSVHPKRIESNDATLSFHQFLFFFLSRLLLFFHHCIKRERERKEE